jgi:hypothetical protein
VAPTAHLALSSGAERYKSTQMMTSANTEDPWIQSFQGSGATRLHSSVDFFSRWKQNQMDPQSESTTQPKARGLLHMECDFAIALPYNLDFKTDELDHLPASRQFKYY